MRRKSFYVLARRIYCFSCSSVRLRKPYSWLVWKQFKKTTCRFLAWPVAISEIGKIAGTFSRHHGWVFVGPCHPCAHGPPAKLEVLHLFRWFTHMYIWYTCIWLLYCDLSRSLKFKHALNSARHCGQMQGLNMFFQFFTLLGWSASGGCGQNLRTNDAHLLLQETPKETGDRQKLDSLKWSSG